MVHSRQGSVSRRTLLGGALAAGGAVVASGVSLPKATAADPPAELPQNSAIVFQGDSITDAGRDRRATGPNDPAGLGRGYPCLLAGALLADHPKAHLKVYNRGISGNKVPDLADRWEADALALKPKLVSILIGVNDIWHKLAGRYAGTVADYETGYRALIERTLRDLPGVRIVVCEPFVLRCGAVNERWFPEFDQRRAVARKLAEALKLTFVPFQPMFDKATSDAPPQFWAGDGVHPTLAGHALMAKTWRRLVGI